MPLTRQKKIFLNKLRSCLKKNQNVIASTHQGNLERFPRSAGIDVGSMLMVVSYTDRQELIQLQQFDSFTDSLYKLADLLKNEGVEIVTMEATGSYWMSLFSIMEDRGMQVVIINPSHFRNVSAQKTDINNAQWLHQLLTHGLLRSSHIAPEAYRELRHYLAERNNCQQFKSDVLNRIQKVLTVMNTKFQHLISDIEGVAGMKLLNAISSGMKDPEALLDQIDHQRLKASREDLLGSLKGDYREHQLYILSEKLKEYRFFKYQMRVYESYIEASLKKLLPVDDSGKVPRITKKVGLVRKNQYHFNLKDYLYVNLSEVEGLDEIGLLTILAVTGNDMSKWPTAAHFFKLAQSFTPAKDHRRQSSRL